MLVLELVVVLESVWAVLIMAKFDAISGIYADAGTVEDDDGCDDDIDVDDVEMMVVIIMVAMALF